MVSEVFLSTERLFIRKVTRDDTLILRDYYLRNREHFRRWEPLRDDTFYSIEGTTSRIDGIQEQMLQGSSLYLVIFLNEALVGNCNLTNIVRSPFEACNLGFSVDTTKQGNGIMYEGLRCILKYTFESMRLHRVMANYKPDNLRSAALLQRLGFEKEGFAREYLKINGKWADHVLTSLIAK